MRVRMWMVLAVAVTIGIPVAARAAEQRQNLLPNPGFDAEGGTDQNHPAAEWAANIAQFEAGGGKFLLDGVVVHGGAKSLKVDGTGTASIFTRSLPVAPGRVYEYSIWVRGARKGQKVGLWYDFGMIEGKHTYTYDTFTVDDAWKQCVSSLEAPKSSSQVTLRVTPEAPMWVDDAFFVETPPSFALEDGRILRVFSPPTNSTRTIQYPRYTIAVPGGGGRGFAGFTLKVGDKVLLSNDGGLGLFVDNKPVFRAYETPIEYAVRDEKGMKELRWSQKSSPALDYAGFITATPKKFAFGEEWTYKQDHPSISHWFSIPLNSAIMGNAQYVFLFDQGDAKQGVLKPENKWQVVEESRSGFLKKAEFYTGDGSFRYTFSFTNITPQGCRMYTTENKTDPAHPNLGIASNPNLEVGGKTGEKRGYSIEIEFMD